VVGRDGEQAQVGFAQVSLRDLGPGHLSFGSQIGTKLNYLYRRKVANVRAHYDETVTHCGGPGSDCGRGYGDEHRSASGLDQTLYFELCRLFDGHDPDESPLTPAGKDDTFTMPYDAVIFSEVQPGLRGTTDHSDARVAGLATRALGRHTYL